MSRAVLREAVRLLEFHSVAQMRRGPGGGLVVAEPQAQASIDTIALYLQYRKPNREDLRCVRDAIEIDNVAKVVKRRAEPRWRPSWKPTARRSPKPATMCVRPQPRSSGSTSGWRNCPATRYWSCFSASSSSCSPALVQHRAGPADLGRRGRRRACAPADSRGDRRRRRQLGPLPHPSTSGCGRLLVACSPRPNPD